MWLDGDVCTSILTAQNSSMQRTNIKLLDKSTGRTLSEINHSKIFLDPPLKGNENKIRK